MRILSFDPSTSGAAYAVIDCALDHFSTLCVGQLTNLNDYRTAQCEVMELVITHRVSAVAFETPAHFAGSAAKFNHLIALSILVGAMSTGVPAQVASYYLPANARGNKQVGGWRPLMLGIGRPPKGQKWDGLVAEYFAATPPENWPARSNGHVRDAAMVGMALFKALSAGDLSLCGASKTQFTAHKDTERRAKEARENNKGKIKDPTTIKKRRPKRV